MDQILVWLEQGRAVVQVEYFDALGRLRRETFYRPTGSLQQALEEIAQALAEQGMQGQPRVRRKQSGRLLMEPKLQTSFWKAFCEASQE